MSSKDKKIAHAVNAILWLWHRLIDDADIYEPDVARRPLYRYPERQAYQDALNSFKHCELIEDYDVVNIRCKIKGVWTSERRVMVFKPTSKRKSKAVLAAMT